MCLYYIDFILLYNLQEDITAYGKLLQGEVNSWSQIGALGLQGIGSNCMYAMGMLVGAYVIRFVPEVASWLIPGGVSSSAGSAAGAVAAGAVSGAVSGAVAAGSVAAPVVGSAGLAAGSAAASTAVNMSQSIYNHSLNRQTGQSPSYSSPGPSK